MEGLQTQPLVWWARGDTWEAGNLTLVSGREAKGEVNPETVTMASSAHFTPSAPQQLEKSWRMEVQEVGRGLTHGAQASLSPSQICAPWPCYPA